MPSPGELLDAPATGFGGHATETHPVRHSYGSTAVFGPVSHDVDPGAPVVRAGASGCGKSTLLRLVAGFERPTEAQVLVAGQPPVPGHSAGVVFQRTRPFPWRSAGGNVEPALKHAGVPAACHPRLEDAHWFAEGVLPMPRAKGVAEQ